MYKQIENHANNVNNRNHVQPNVNTPNQTNINPSHNIETFKCSECPSEFEHHTRNDHRRTDAEIITYSAIAKIGIQLENILQRLQSVEQKSMADFPILGGAQKKL